jgi:hypothetical protein
LCKSPGHDKQINCSQKDTATIVIQVVISIEVMYSMSFPHPFLLTIKIFDLETYGFSKKKHDINIGFLGATHLKLGWYQ